MKLYDPSRPSLNGRQTYLNGWAVIQPLSVWPLPDGTVELSVMLPLQGEGFAAKWFRRRVEIETLRSWVEWFHDNPEVCLEDLFTDDAFKPNLRKSVTAETASGLKPDLRPNLNPDLSELDELELDDEVI